MVIIIRHIFFVCCLIQLSGCFNYSPSEVEAADRLRSTKEAYILLNRILFESDMMHAEFPGTKWANTLVYGNYKGRNSHISAKYYSNSSALAVCKRIYSYFDESKIWEISKYGGQCKGTEHDRTVSYGFSARQPKLSSENESFLASVNVTERELPKLLYGKSWKTVIHYRIYRSLDSLRSRECIRENMPNEVQPCKDYDWHEKRLKIDEKKSSDKK